MTDVTVDVEVRCPTRGMCCGSVRCCGSPTHSPPLVWQAFGFESEETTKKETVEEEAAERAAHEHLIYKDNKESFHVQACRVYDFILEVGNEAGDVVFTFQTLRNDTSNQLLYWLSIGFLVLSLIGRLTFAVLWYRGKVDWERRRWFYGWGVLLSLFEPMTGQLVIEMSLKDKGDMKTEWGRTSGVSDGQVSADNARATIKSSMSIAVVMLLLEDVPELIIDVVYAIRTEGGIGDVGLFAFTMIFTLFHICRVLAELWFEYKSLKEIPGALAVTSASDFEKLTKTKWKSVNQYCDIALAYVAKHTSQDSLLTFIKFLLHESKTLSYLE